MYHSSVVTLWKQEVFKTDLLIKFKHNIFALNPLSFLSFGNLSPIHCACMRACMHVFPTNKIPSQKSGNHLTKVTETTVVSYHQAQRYITPTHKHFHSSICLARVVHLCELWQSLHALSVLKHNDSLGQAALARQVGERKTHAHILSSELAKSRC